MLHLVLYKMIKVSINLKITLCVRYLNVLPTALICFCKTKYFTEYVSKFKVYSNLNSNSQYIYFQILYNVELAGKITYETTMEWKS